MDRSTRAQRRSTGYKVPSQESTSRALRAAQRVVNKEKLLSKRNTKGENDETTTSISKTNAAGDQQKNKKCRQVRKRPLGRDDLQSIGKRMRRSTKAAQGIRNVSTVSLVKPNDNNDTNTTIDNVIRGNERVTKSNCNGHVNEPCPRSPSPLTDKPNGDDHLMSNKEPLNNNDTVSTSDSEHVPSVIPDLTHTTLRHSDQIKDTTKNSSSTNSKSPDEEIITKLVGQLDDINVNEVLEAIADNDSVGSIGSLLNINYEKDTNTKTTSSRRSSSNSHSIDSVLNIEKDYTSIPKNNTIRKIEKIEDIITGFNLPKSTKSNLPSLKDSKEENLKIRKPRKYSTLLSILIRCIKQLVEITCPGPNENDIMKSLASTKIMSGTNCKTGAYYNNGNTTLVGRNKKTSSTSDSDLLKSLVESAFDIMKVSPRASIQRRVVRAILVQGIQKTSILKDLAALCKHTRIDSGTSYKQAKKDYNVMINGAVLCKTDYARKSVNDDVIEDAVSFLLDRDNITTVSWGNIDCVLSEDETVVLPQITRRATRKVLWERYCEAHVEKSDQYLKRTSMYEIMKAITRSGQKILSSVDYVQSLLVSDTVENIQNMIDDLIEDAIMKETMENYLESSSVFLKYTFNHHAMMDNDESASHGL